jgi:N-acetylneuraminate synthase
MSIFIIAEIGINHNGDIEIAKKLIDNACDAGCDAVKFQKRTINLVYDKKTLDSPRESPWGSTTKEQKEGLEFGRAEYDIIDTYCNKKNIKWFASAWDLESLNFLDHYKLHYHKIASAMIVDKNFVNEVAKRGVYTFISTGMSSKKDIDFAVNTFKSAGTDFELMHCISTYPMKTEDANLSTIEALRKEYDCKVGYSGHEPGLAISYGAASLGISSLERHITIDRSMYGSDQSASIERNGLIQLVGTVRKIELAMGKPMLGNITNEEKIIAKKLRAHINL